MATQITTPGGDVTNKIVLSEAPITFSRSWTTYMPVLAKVLSITTGDVLELGTGIFSTPYLHWVCYSSDRKLVSYENNAFYSNIASQYVDDFHEVYITGAYGEIDIEKEWDVVFIDFFETQDRHIPLEKMLDHAKYIVVHDSLPSSFPNVSKYRYDYTDLSPGTSVFSNLIDLSTFET